MANVYTTLFYAASLPPTVAFTDPVPDGLVHVVKDICVTGLDDFFDPPGGCSVSDDDGITIWKVSGPAAINSVSFHWFGTQVIPAGKRLEIITNWVTTEVRISGFALTLP